MGKAREFWIMDEEFKEVMNPTVETLPPVSNKKSIHVIDKSAYDKAVEALKFYTGNKDTVAYRTLKDLGEVE